MRRLGASVRLEVHSVAAPRLACMARTQFSRSPAVASVGSTHSPTQRERLRLRTAPVARLNRTLEGSD